MKRLTLLLVILITCGLCFSQSDNKNSEIDSPKKESTYRKATKLLDSVAKKLKPAAEKAAKGIVEDTAQGIQDFADDLNAPKEEQSGFAKAFNFIADSHPEDNMGAHEKGYALDDGIMYNGKDVRHDNYND